MADSFFHIIHALGPGQIEGMNTKKLLECFTARDLFEGGELRAAYWEVDRTVVGGAIPRETGLKLGNPSFLRSEFLCQRRELGILNLGPAGVVVVDGETFELGAKDGLYVGKGTREVEFRSADPADPAAFYFLSYPAHAELPTALVRASSIEPVELGSQQECNERSLYKMICPGTVDSCQLVMGYTVLKPGSVWNTMPPHTHGRRSEVYLYFDVPQDKAVMHFMGEPSETRHLVLRDREVALSPSWSIHCGAGVGNYSFVWGMGGENQDFSDMDHLSVDELQ